MMKASLPGLFVVPFLALAAMPAHGQSVRPDVGSATADGERSEARWADWEAQSRMIEGDYDGAVEANRQAETARQEQQRLEMAGPSKR